MAAKLAICSQPTASTFDICSKAGTMVPVIVGKGQEARAFVLHEGLLTAASASLVETQ